MKRQPRRATVQRQCSRGRRWRVRLLRVPLRSSAPLPPPSAPIKRRACSCASPRAAPSLTCPPARPTSCYMLDGFSQTRTICGPSSVASRPLSSLRSLPSTLHHRRRRPAFAQTAAHMPAMPIATTAGWAPSSKHAPLGTIALSMPPRPAHTAPDASHPLAHCEQRASQRPAPSFARTAPEAQHTALTH